jgi:hypothetical protein
VQKVHGEIFDVPYEDGIVQFGIHKIGGYYAITELKTGCYCTQYAKKSEAVKALPQILTTLAAWLKHNVHRYIELSFEYRQMVSEAEQQLNNTK